MSSWNAAAPEAAAFLPPPVLDAGEELPQRAQRGGRLLVERQVGGAPDHDLLAAGQELASSCAEAGDVVRSSSPLRTSTGRSERRSGSRRSIIP
jgi:hypothetical protein